MGIEEKLPSGIALTTVEKLAGYMRKASIWPATFGLACCAIEMMATAATRYLGSPVATEAPAAGAPSVALCLSKESSQVRLEVKLCAYENVNSLACRRYDWP